MHPRPRCQLLLTCVVACALAGLVLVPAPGVVAAQLPDVSTASSFQLSEQLDASGSASNVSGIQLDVPASGWAVDRVDVNITSIEQHREHVAVEDRLASTHDTVYKSLKGRAVQLVVGKPARIYAVELYLEQTGTRFSEVLVQINGYNPATNAPNSTRFGYPALVNVTATAGWHVQRFPEPVYLPVGNYFICINGSGYQPSDNSVIRWYFNETAPRNPSLRVSSLSAGSWTAGITGKPYLYKVERQVNETYMPSEIDMKVLVGGLPVAVIDGPAPGTGRLLATPASMTSTVGPLIFPVMTNRSLVLKFNFTWSIRLARVFSSPGYVVTRVNGNITWHVLPSLMPHAGQHVVQLPVPNRWQALQVFKDGVDVTSGTVLAGGVLRIPGAIITSGASWDIQASSPGITFSLMVPLEEYAAGQDLRVTVTAPSSQGTLEFIVFDAHGSLEHRETRASAVGNIFFSYPLPFNAFTGDAAAAVVWMNGTDAGMQARGFAIVPPLDTRPLVVTLVAGVVAAAASFVAYKAAKRRAVANARRRAAVVNKARDLLNLDSLIVVERRSGVDVYERSFTTGGLSSTLVSGFVSAISSFGIELAGSERASQSIKLEYQDMKILISEFRDFRLTLVLKETPSADFMAAVGVLLVDIEEKFGKIMKNFNGETTEFAGIDLLFKKHLHTTFLSPLEMHVLASVKLTHAEQRVMVDAGALVESGNGRSITARDLLAGEWLDDERRVGAIFSLIDKGVLRPAGEGL